MTDTELSLGEIDQLVAGHHHDPHSILGAHPGPDGVVVRAFRPLARSVTVVLDDGRRFGMDHLYQGVFTVTLPDEKVPEYRIATAYLYLAPSAAPGMNSSHTPELPSERIGNGRPSQ